MPRIPVVLNPATNQSSVVAIHGGHDIKKGAFSGTLRQLGIDIDDFINFMEKKS